MIMMKTLMKHTLKHPSMLLSRYLQKFTYSTIERGEGFSRSIYLVDDHGQEISFWNDISLRGKDFAKDEVNVCIEIPQISLAKLELTKEKVNHPITQDTRKNKHPPHEKELRYYAQYPLFNYGFIPQTWESSIEPTPEGFAGDDDPLDILELGTPNKKTGDVLRVKVLGCFCLIDQGEVDWKLLTLNSKEAQELKINNLDDLERLQGGRLNAIKNWFKYIKTFDGKKPNEIHYNEKIFPAEKALEVIEETHSHWQALAKKKHSTTQGLVEKQKKFNF